MTFSSEQLSDAERAQVRRVVDLASDADGVSPVNESGSLIISGKRSGQFLTMVDREIVAFSVADPREETVQVAVAPEHRRRGLGAMLVSEMLAAFPEFSVWAFGTLPAARELARAVGLEPARELLKMGRPLKDEPAPPVLEDYTISAYREQDAEAVVEVNRLAFAHHPEQGRLTLDEFHQLTAQPWFSAAGLLVARDSDGQVAGFHWTKRHDQTTGEVYVLAVHPDHGGHGLGRALLEAGLAHLEAVGCTQVHLYVEGSQERVVRLYESARFDRISMDTAYRAAA